MIRIFLAHASEDKKPVIGLYNRLKEKGFQPWLDVVDLLPGQNWRAEIPKAIKNSDIFIACLSQQSVKKQGYIQREFRMALNEMGDRPAGQIYLIPLRLDNCRIPELRQEEYGVNLADYQWVNLFEPDGFERLVKGIEAGMTSTIDSCSEDVIIQKQTYSSRDQVGLPQAEMINTMKVGIDTSKSALSESSALTLGQQLKLQDRKDELEKLKEKIEQYNTVIEESTDIDIEKKYQLRKDRIFNDIDRITQEIQEIEQGNG